MFFVVQPGFLSYYLYSWSNAQSYHWLPRRDIAKRFTRCEAQRIVAQINARGHINPAHIELAK